MSPILDREKKKLLCARLARIDVADMLTRLA